MGEEHTCVFYEVSDGSESGTMTAHVNGNLVTITACRDKFIMKCDCGRTSGSRTGD